MAAKKLAVMVPEPLRDAGSQREACTTCGRWDKRPQGAWLSQWGKPHDEQPRILCVLEQPDEVNEDTVNRLRYYLSQTPIKNCWLGAVSALRCGNKKPSMKQIRACRPFLLTQIQERRPTHILLMGEIAIKAGLDVGSEAGVITHRGRPLTLPQVTGPLVYATYGMGGIECALHLEPRIIEDFTRMTWGRLEYPITDLPVVDTTKERDWVSVDSEYSPTGELLTLGVAGPHAAMAQEPGDPYYEDVLNRIKQAQVLIAHSASGDIDQLVKLGLCKSLWAWGWDVMDTYLMARMTDENRGPGAYNVESLLMSSHNVKPWKDETDAIGIDATQWGAPLRKERCALDAWAAAVLHVDMRGKVPGPVRLTHQIGAVLGRIEKAGVYIDTEKFEAWSAETERERNRLMAGLKMEAAKHGLFDFEPTNDNHLRILLFEKLGFPVQKRTETKKACVDKHTLNKFKADSPFVQTLIEFNKVDKLFTTQIEGVRPLIVDGRIPVHLSPVTRTGRRASQNPNMQNWPKVARQMVRSRFKGGKILELDYKSLEPFLLAFVAKEPKLDDYFRNRGGYIGIAKDIFQKDVDKKSADYRAVKGVVLGTNYNATPWTIATNLRDAMDPPVLLHPSWPKHVDLTEELQNKYFRLFPGLKAYMRQCAHLIETYDKVTTLTGRERHLPVESDEADNYKHMLNQAINYRIQGLASDVTGSAMVDVETELVNRYYNGDILGYHLRLLNRDWPDMPILINEIHDALLFDVPPHYCNEEVYQEIESVMCAVPSLRELIDFPVQLMVDRKVGDTWGLE